MIGPATICQPTDGCQMLMDWQTKHVVDIHSCNVAVRNHSKYSEKIMVDSHQEVEPSQSSPQIHLFIYLMIPTFFIFR